MKFPPTITGSIHLGRAGDRAGAHGREPRPPWLRWLGTPRNALGLSALAAGVTAGTPLTPSLGAASAPPPPPPPPPPARRRRPPGHPAPHPPVTARRPP